MYIHALNVHAIKCAHCDDNDFIIGHKLMNIHDENKVAQSDTDSFLPLISSWTSTLSILFKKYVIALHKSNIKYLKRGFLVAKEQEVRYIK